MSDLQLGLLVIGALVVGGVLAFNRLQERAAQKRTDAAFRSAHPDALLGGGGAAPDPAEPVADARPAPAPAHPRPAGAPGHPLPVEGLDYVVALEGAEPVVASALLERWATIEHRFRGRTSLAGADGGGGWHGLAVEGGSHSRYRVGLQLVSRAGVVGEAELIEFRSEVENLGARLGLHANAPEMKAALDAARALDAFCADRDIQVALHVVARAREGFDRAAVRGLGEGHGLAPQPDGAFAHLDAQGRLLFRLTDRSGARLDAEGAALPALLALSIAMDVPRTPDTGRSFEAMARLARGLAGELGGTVVDDNGTALDERALAAIEAQLDGVRAELEARGFAPGEPQALRLFS